MTNIVKHPETGKAAIPSFVEVDSTVVDAELAQAQEAFNAIQAQLAAAHEQVTLLTEQHTQAEAVLNDKKSIKEAVSAINDEPAVDAGTEGASSEVASPEVAGDTTEPASEPAGDSGAGDGSAATVVPVQVETPAEEVAAADEY